DRRALAAKKSLLGPEHLDVWLSTANLALTLHDLGRDEEAEPLARQAAEHCIALVGPDNARAAQYLLNHGEILTDLRRFAEAEVAIRRALAIWAERGASPFFEGYGLMDLGRLKLAAGNPREAGDLLQRAVAILAKQDAGVAAEAEFALAQAI